MYPILSTLITLPPWRNWLARSAVNRKVGGSSPPGGAISFCYFIIIEQRFCDFSQNLMQHVKVEYKKENQFLCKKNQYSFFLYFSKKKEDVYSTKYSQAVTHPSTNLAQCCLTSVIRRELVYSTWYGRRDR